MLTHIEQKINAHTEAVRKGKLSPDQEICPKCKGHPPSFKLHEKRERSFLIIVDSLVRKVISLLMRWKCPLCKRTFTEYPSFALPQKRYVRESVVGMSQEYIQEERMTYREVVGEKGMAVGYEGKGNEIDERQLAASTLWRWVGFVGGLKKTILRGLSLIRGKDPSSGIFREVNPVAPGKYRSHKRKLLLQRCLQLFSANKEFHRLFGSSIFLRLAVGCSWG